MIPCFSDVCGYSCKDVQTSRLTVRSCSPLHCHCLTDAHRRQKKQSSILGFGTKVLEIVVPKTHPEFIHVYLKQRECIGWRIEWIDAEWLNATQSPRYKCRFSHLAWQHKVWCPCLASFGKKKAKQATKGAQHSTITFIVGSRAVTKQLLQENGTHSCATRAHSRCFEWWLASAAVHASWVVIKLGCCHRTVFQRCLWLQLQRCANTKADSQKL